MHVLPGGGPLMDVAPITSDGRNCSVAASLKTQNEAPCLNGGLLILFSVLDGAAAVQPSKERQN